jgi:hypothetical protein
MPPPPSLDVSSRRSGGLDPRARGRCRSRRPVRKGSASSDSATSPILTASAFPGDRGVAHRLPRRSKRGVPRSRQRTRQRLRPSPYECKVDDHIGRFRACSTFAHVTARLIAGPPRGPLSRRLRRFRYLHHRSDSFRPERTRGRGEWVPLESQNHARRTLMPLTCDKRER